MQVLVGNSHSYLTLNFKNNARQNQRFGTTEVDSQNHTEYCLDTRRPPVRQSRPLHARPSLPTGLVALRPRRACRPGPIPLPPSYPDELNSLGDHLRKKRLDEGDYQKEVAQKLGVSPDTINNWEQGHTEPSLRHIPRIIDYLGYVPFETGETWGQKIEGYRMITGTPRSELADRLGVDEDTIFRWETGRSVPSKTNQSELKSLFYDIEEMIS